MLALLNSVRVLGCSTTAKDIFVDTTKFCCYNIYETYILRNDMKSTNSLVVWCDENDPDMQELLKDAE